MFKPSRKKYADKNAEAHHSHKRLRYDIHHPGKEYSRQHRQHHRPGNLFSAAEKSIYAPIYSAARRTDQCIFPEAPILQFPGDRKYNRLFKQDHPGSKHEHQHQCKRPGESKPGS